MKILYIERNGYCEEYECAVILSVAAAVRHIADSV